MADLDSERELQKAVRDTCSQIASMRKAIGAMRIVGLAAVALILVGAMWFAGYIIQPNEQTETTSWNPSENLTFSNVTYTVNGLTCYIPTLFQSYNPAIMHLAPWVTKTPGFLTVAGGGQFVLGSADNIGEGSECIGTQCVPTPPTLEMTFYLRDSQNACQTLNGDAWNYIDVEVPIQNNQFNLTGATCSGDVYRYLCSSGQDLIP